MGENEFSCLKILFRHFETVQSRNKETANRTVHIVDVSFQVDQLQRVKEIRNQLENRNIALETERNTPSQIQLKKKAVVPCPNGLW